MTASSGMTFSLSPACSAPTVTTAASEAASSRDTMVCSRRTVAAAITTGSILAWGIDPCAPRPNIRICRLSAADVITPARLPIDPAGPTITCWPKITSGFGKRVSSPASTMALGAPACLLGRLEHQHQRPLPGISRVGQESGRAHQPRHVHVVAACVHDGNGLAGAIGRRLCAGIRQASLFSNRQRVHVGTEHDRRPVTIAQQPDDSGLADAVGHLVSRAAQMVRRDARGARLLHGELGVGVDVGVDALESPEGDSEYAIRVRSPASP